MPKISWLIERKRQRERKNCSTSSDSAREAFDRDWITQVSRTVSSVVASFLCSTQVAKILKKQNFGATTYICYLQNKPYWWMLIFLFYYVISIVFLLFKQLWFIIIHLKSNDLLKWCDDLQKKLTYFGSNQFWRTRTWFTK